MKMIRNTIIMTTECCGFMNLSLLGFEYDLTTKKPIEKSGIFTTRAMNLIDMD